MCDAVWAYEKGYTVMLDVPLCRTTWHTSILQYIDAGRNFFQSFIYYEPSGQTVALTPTWCSGTGNADQEWYCIGNWTSFVDHYCVQDPLGSLIYGQSCITQPTGFNDLDLLTLYVDDSHPPRTGQTIPDDVYAQFVHFECLENLKRFRLFAYPISPFRFYPTLAVALLSAPNLVSIGLSYINTNTIQYTTPKRATEVILTHVDGLFPIIVTLDNLVRLNAEHSKIMLFGHATDTLHELVMNSTTSYWMITYSLTTATNLTRLWISDITVSGQIPLPLCSISDCDLSGTLVCAPVSNCCAVQTLCS